MAGLLRVHRAIAVQAEVAARAGNAVALEAAVQSWRRARRRAWSATMASLPTQHRWVAQPGAAFLPARGTWAWWERRLLHRRRMKRERARQRELKRLRAGQVVAVQSIGAPSAGRAARLRALARQTLPAAQVDVAARGPPPPPDSHDVDSDATTGSSDPTQDALADNEEEGPTHRDGTTDTTDGLEVPGGSEGVRPEWEPGPAVTDGTGWAVGDLVGTADLLRELYQSVEFGVNGLGYAGEDRARKYGSLDAILDDLVKLGVQLARQPGEADLLIPFLMGAEADEDLELPLADDIAASFKPKALKNLLRKAWTAGIEVALTLGTLGGGSTKVQPSASGKVVDCIAGIRWSSGHEGAEIDGNTFGLRGTTFDEQQEYLDIRDGYQRAWLARYAQEVALLLKRLREEIRSEDGYEGFQLGHVIRRVELFNEIDIRNTRDCNREQVNAEPWSFGEESWTTSGQDWARTCFGMAIAFRSVFPRGDAIELWLPGITSYDIDEDDLQDLVDEELADWLNPPDNKQASLRGRKEYRHTWSWKLRFLEAFLAEYAGLASDAGVDLYDVAAGVDYHWYHRARHHHAPDDEDDEKVSLGTLPCSRLAWEVGRIRSCLDASGFTRAEISVMESGISCKDASDDFVPTNLEEREGLGLRWVFQAQEVVRRLLAAAASGASVVGWHCFQGTHDSTAGFYGLGLRQDGEGEVASTALRRPSWWVYQRVVQLFGASRAYAVVLPADAVSDPVNDGTRFYSIYPGAYLDELERDVVAFELGPLVVDGYVAEHGYVLLLDRWRDWDGPVHAMGLRISVGRSTGLRYPSALPSAIGWYEGEPPSGEFPPGWASFTEDSTFSVPSSLDIELDVNSDPTFLVCDETYRWFAYS